MKLLFNNLSKLDTFVPEQINCYIWRKILYLGGDDVGFRAYILLNYIFIDFKNE